MSMPYLVSPIKPADHNWVKEFLISHWGSNRIVTRGKIYQADQLPGFTAVAMEQIGDFETGEPVGLITFTIVKDQCEIVSLDSLVERIGIGTQLIQRVESAARELGCKRLWLVTTNDNTPALRFYQKRLFQLAAVYPGAIELSRQLKPEIPLLGINGIPIRDEIELEKIL